MRRKISLIAQVIARGFDRSFNSREYDGTFSKAVTVRCSQCEAVCINGMPCHETGCINEIHD